MSKTVIFLVYLFVAMIPSSAWTAQTPAKIAELEKSLLTLQTENQTRTNQFDQRQKSLETKLNELEKRLAATQLGAKTGQPTTPPKEQSAEQVAKATIDSADSVIKAVTIVFTVLSILIASAAFFGFKEFSKIRTHRRRAQRALDGAVLLARASQSLITADVTPDDPNYADLKKIRVLVGLSMIEDLLSKGHEEAAIHNWHALALKRLGDVGGALEATEKALLTGRVGTYEYKRALYNKACYLTLLANNEEDKKDVYPILKRAIRNDPHLGKVALIDKDLDGLDPQKRKALVAESI
jgi:hypothetical protein